MWLCQPSAHHLKEMGEEELWELINDNRHRISLGVRPCIVIPYLRQARVLTEMDEDEILSCHNLTNRCMRTSYMLDLLRTQGRNGAVALLESLMIHYPTLYTQVTGRKPSTEPSRFSGLIKYSELTEYLVRAVTGMQKELQEARCEAGRMSARCASLELEIGQIMEQEEKSRCLQSENERMQRYLCSLQRDVTKLKDEKCDLYIRYTAAIEEQSAVNERLHNLNLQVSDFHSSLFCTLGNSEMHRKIFFFLLLLDQKQCLSLQVEQLTLDCKMHQQKSTMIQSQMRELQAERDQVRNCQQSHHLNFPVCCLLKHFNASLFASHLTSLPRTLAPPFLVRSRPKAIRVNGRILSISFQGEELLRQLTVVGGNKTGVFVHQVTEGSAAHTVGISNGAQIVEVKYEQNHKALKMVLEDSTLEEAMWALSQVTGLCHLSLRPRQDDYEALLQQLRSCETSSGDSFYVRVNMSLPAGPGGTLAVSCNDILHVTNTQPAGTEDMWYASQVHPCQLLDLQSGTVPNYYRLVVSFLIPGNIPLAFQICRVVAQNKQKAVRIVSTGRLGRNPLWVSVEGEKTKSVDSGTKTCSSCVTLMPYTLVTPHYPPICRPVLLLPTVLGRILDKKLAGWQGFQLCEPEVLSFSEHTAHLQRSEILEECGQGRCCYTLQSVEKVMKKVRTFNKNIRSNCTVYVVVYSQYFSKHSRSKLQRHGQSEDQLLACSRSEEPLLDKLPCLYHTVAPDSWCDQTSLLTSLRTIIWEEQKKIVWVEPDLW
uniref:Caspase recruitment domain family, member 14 n=1 Tax=Amphiprion percula TaxID=161767 RepID=A0A3P8TAE8_AMPPE